MGSGSGGGGQANPYYSMGVTPSDGGLQGALGSKVGGIAGTSYGGLLAGGMRGLGGATPKQQAAPAMNYNAPVMPYVPPPQMMQNQFYGGQ